MMAGLLTVSPEGKDISHTFSFEDMASHEQVPERRRNPRNVSPQ